MSQQQVNIADLDLSSLQQVKTQLEEVFFFFFTPLITEKCRIWVLNDSLYYLGIEPFDPIL